MKICIAGLGLIGGSMAMALKRAGYAVDGYNRSRPSLEFALNAGAIDHEVTDFTQYDVIIVAMPYSATLAFFKSVAPTLSASTVLMDICGVKQSLEDAFYHGGHACAYVGLHPMAGKEVSTIANADETLYDRASMVITHCDKTQSWALDLARKLTQDMGFARIVECSAQVHDQKIAYTSQLAHVVANCYVKDDEIDSCFGFTGGSFQDMTRIAGVDETMWRELYIANADNLIHNIDLLTEHLQQVKDAIASKNVQTLSDCLALGRLRFEASKDRKMSDDIVITPLK